MSEDGGYFETAALERLQYVILTYLSKELAEDFAISPKVEVSQYASFMKDLVAVHIVQDIVGRRMEEVECRYPADWWQACIPGS